MFQRDLQGHADNNVENLYLQDIYHLVPKVVGQVCASLGHYPGQAGLDDYIQEISMLLLENDRRALRSFDHRSKLQTWLYVITKRHILHRLQKWSKMESLDDIPQHSSNFIVQPKQEEKLFRGEMRAILEAAFSKLTAHEQKLLALWLREMSIKEIAKEMGIKKRSVSRERNTIIKKLQKIVIEDHVCV
ncbi:MAG TPA: sigma-70 family RNA polymerase sigma factor, partial [Blastocatellia bacterium]|nr:sigma-70 family RNA polymerase sigma factor [Blastocatellia bacterium]